MENQISYRLDVGRIGMTLNITVFRENLEILKGYEADINGTGMRITRLVDPGDEKSSEKVEVCNRESFLYPDRVDEGEIDLLKMLLGVSPPSDTHMIHLCSMLCAQWQAGHTEEMLHNTISSYLDRIQS